MDGEQAGSAEAKIFQKQLQRGRQRVNDSKVMRIALLCMAATLTGLAPAAARDDSHNTTPADKPETNTKTSYVLEPAPVARFYGSVDYLYWWVKAAPLSVPLVSSGPVTETHHGLLGVPALDASESSILYGAPHSPAQGGNNSQAFPAFSGARLTVGYWLDDERRFAIEGGAFSLQRQAAGYENRGGSDGNPVLGIPVYNSVPYTIGSQTIFPGEDSLPFSLPDSTNRARGSGIITGGVSIQNTLQLWGSGLSGVINLYRNDSWEISGVAGVQYLDLSEDFSLTADIEGVTGPYAGQSGIVWDRFETRNQFSGGNFGLRAHYKDGPLGVTITGLVAPGVNHQTTTISGGFTSVNFTAPTDSGPEGIFSQPSNDGRYTTDKFCVVPELQFKISYALTSWLRASIGYDFMYMSNVIRPTDQINRELPKGQTFNQADPTVSTTSPSVIYKSTDFYAQGMSFGLEFSF
jgi:hypothetical protein